MDAIGSWIMLPLVQAEEDDMYFVEGDHNGASLHVFDHTVRNEAALPSSRGTETGSEELGNVSAQSLQVSCQAVLLTRQITCIHATSSAMANVLSATCICAACSRKLTPGALLWQLSHDGVS